MVQRYVRTPRVIASSSSPRRRSSSPLFISSCLVHRTARISIRVSIDAIGAEQSKRGERQVDPRMHAGADADAGTLRHSITYPISQPASQPVIQSVSQSALGQRSAPSGNHHPRVPRSGSPRHATPRRKQLRNARAGLLRSAQLAESRLHMRMSASSLRLAVLFLSRSCSVAVAAV
jgi:hypothetical protein